MRIMWRTFALLALFLNNQLQKSTQKSMLLEIAKRWGFQSDVLISCMKAWHSLAGHLQLGKTRVIELFELELSQVIVPFTHFKAHHLDVDGLDANASKS